MDATIQGNLELNLEVVALNKAHREGTIYLPVHQIIYIEVETDDELLVRLAGGWTALVVNDDSPGCLRLRELFGVPHPDDVAEYMPTGKVEE